MKRIIVLCSLLASFTFAQLPSVAVMQSLSDEESKISPQELSHLTKELHSIAGTKLPLDKFSLMPIDEVQKTYEKRFGSKDGGAKAYSEDCEEGKCMGRIVDELGFNFGARCDFSTVRKQLYLNCELYGTLEGESQSRSLGRIEPTPIKDFNEAQALIKKKAPDMFDKITKTPRELCMAEKKIWDNGACKTTEQIAMDKCSNAGKNWVDGACKSMDQIACEAEAKSGKRWSGDECKTAEQIACENKGSVWMNGICLSQAATPAPAGVAQAAGGNYVAQIVTQPAGASLLLNGSPYQGCPKTPCQISLYENRVRLSATLSEHETKDTTVTITMPNQLIAIKLKPKTYSVSFTSEPSRASMVLEDDQYTYKCQTPCNMSFTKGRVKVSVGLDTFYERKDTTIYVSEDGQYVNFKLDPNYGTLDINPAYSDGIGKNESWTLKTGGESFPLGQIGLLPGDHQIRLTHRCYEDITARARIGRNETTNFDMSDKLVLKQGTLVLKAERYYSSIFGFSKQTKVPFSVNGKAAGETDFNGSVPLCSEIEIDNQKVYVSLKQGDPAEYTYRTRSYWPSIVSSIAGAAILAYGLYQNSEIENVYKKEYVSLESVENGSKSESDVESEYNKAWDKVESTKFRRNLAYILGSASFAVGVILWF